MTANAANGREGSRPSGCAIAGKVRWRRARPAPRSCRRGPGRPWVAAVGEADLRPRRSVVGAQPSGRLTGLQPRSALRLLMHRLEVRRLLSETSGRRVVLADPIRRDAVERSPLIV